MNEQALKTTPLFDRHVAANAAFTDFGGWNMPVRYTSDLAEHAAVRTAAGLFDISHMAEFFISGNDSRAFLDYALVGVASEIGNLRAKYSLIVEASGGIVDDLIVYRLKDQQYLLVVNASNIDKDWNWISSHNDLGVDMRNISEDYSLLAIQGPKAVEAMQALTSVDLANIKYYHFEVGPFAGIENVIISATGYTGSGGFEIYCKNDEVEQVWNKVFEAGAAFGIKPIGLAARDTLRLEMGFCLYGNDINDTTSPLEAGLGWITKFTKEFTNSGNLKQQKEVGVTKKLVGFELIERGIPRHDYEIVDADGNNIGIVTSGTMAPSLGKGIGMGYVKTEFAAVDSDIYIQIRNNKVKAKVTKMPFYKK